MQYVLAWFSIIFLTCSCKHNTDSNLLSAADDCVSITMEDALKYSDNVSDCLEDQFIDRDTMVGAREAYIGLGYIYKCPETTCCNLKRKCCSLSKCGALTTTNPEPITGINNMIDCGLGEDGSVLTKGGILDIQLICNRKFNVGASVLHVQYGDLTDGNWTIKQIKGESNLKPVTLVKGADGDYTFTLTCSIPLYRHGQTFAPLESVTKVYNYKLSRQDIEGFLDEKARKKCLKETWKDRDFVGLSLSIESVRDTSIEFKKFDFFRHRVKIMGVRMEK